ncbi:uncharacterized protein LOC130666378 [Microplitis mediator]|uniref:uncharacterized protein LOC130666378 n=1 Tax=Microplitis mediator TaxID=375433 RepID=UPI002553DA51|nr:uncharacterized protein LOC130666378 [Microplitis mediator]
MEYNEELDKRVNLVLVIHNYKTTVNKKKAMENSNYFNSLLSGNFPDHNLEEHSIKYEISVETFQNFIDWIDSTSSENKNTEYIYPDSEESLKKISNNYDNLLELLDTSVLFISDKLSRQLTQIIIKNWLLPEKLFQLWKFAKERSLLILRDVVFETYLDRFDDVPEQELKQLPLENLKELITNCNFTSRSKLLGFVTSKSSPKSSTDSIDQGFLDKISGLDFDDKNNKPEYAQCVVSYKLNDENKKVYCVHWWKDRKFTEIDGFNAIFDLLDAGYQVVGRRIIGRRFSIYVIGGEKGIGTGRFIKSIWRFCLISRTWYHVAELPTARRHMIAEILDHDIYLLGGVGSFRVKLSSAEAFNLYTNKWTTLSDIPEEFTDTPPSCVINKAIVYSSEKHWVYYPEYNEWYPIEDPLEQFRPYTEYYALVPQPSTEDQFIFNAMKVSNSGDNEGNSVVDIFEKVAPTNSCSKKFLITESRRSFNKRFYRHIYSGRELVSFSCEENKIIVETESFWNGVLRENDICFTQTVDNINPSLFDNNLGCFNVIDPDTLYKKIIY